MASKDEETWDTPARVSSQELEEGEPFPHRVVSPSDLDEIPTERVTEAIDEGVLPSLGSIRASNQREQLTQVARWYLVYRKFAFSKGESRLRAEKRVAETYEIRQQNLHVYYGRVASANEDTPTAWFTDRLEEFWEWQSDHYDPLPDPSLRDSCRRLKRALFDIQKIPTPALSADDFTVGDFLDAGDQHVVNDPNVLVQTDNPEQPFEEKSIRLRDNASVKLYDLTKYSVPWAESWKSVLEVIDTHLTRWLKVDDAASLTNGWDCSEAYARWPPEDPESNTRLDPHVQLSVLYHGNGYMDIGADVWPPWVTELEKITFSATSTQYTDDAVNAFIVEALRKAEETAP